MMSETKPADAKGAPDADGPDADGPDADGPDADGDDAVNEIGAAGQSADPFVDRPVSGQPAGGPHTLGKEAHDRARDERRGA